MATRESLDAIYEEYARTGVLGAVAGGKRLVKGHGPLDAPVVVVGEAPGEDEDRTGRPFTGPSGQLLRALMGEAGIPWGACYVTNVLPWRPPGNRAPYQFEVVASEARLAAEVAAVGPEVVIAAGDCAWRCVTRGRLGSFREGRLAWRELDGRRLLGVFHPSFLLRQRGEDRREYERQVAGALSGALRAAA